MAVNGAAVDPGRGSEGVDDRVHVTELQACRVAAARPGLQRPRGEDHRALGAAELVAARLPGLYPALQYRPQPRLGDLPDVGRSGVEPDSGAGLALQPDLPQVPDVLAGRQNPAVLLEAPLGGPAQVPADHPGYLRAPGQRLRSGGTEQAVHPV
jgi:hypothetical protein